MKLSKFICILLALASFLLVGCEIGIGNETTAEEETTIEAETTTAEETTAEKTTAEETAAEETTTEYVPTEEELMAAERQEYLDSISFPNYTLLEENTLYFLGRWFDKEIDGVSHKVTVTDGATFYFMTDGASSFDLHFTVMTEDIPWFAYSVDGATPTRQLVTEPTVTLPDTGMHTVCIYADGMTECEGLEYDEYGNVTNRNESKYYDEKGFALKEVTVDGGKIFGIKPRNKVIAYYGDSITEGVNALATAVDIKKGKGATGDYNSATGAYPYYVSKNLGALTYSVGYGASGVTNTGSFNTFITAIDKMSDTREDNFEPDVIVINHGTNDVWVAQNSPELFKSELRVALNRIIEKNPDKPIIYVVPFGIENDWLEPAREAIREVVAEYDEIDLVESRGWILDRADGVHITKSKAGSFLAGKNIANAIKEILGEDFFKVD